MELFSIIFTVLTTGLVFAISLYGFDRIWLKQHHGDIPSTEDSSITTSIRNGNQQVKSFRELIKVFGPILWEFDTKYWIKNIGLDGYSYLYFQREMLKMFILFGISSSAVLIPFKIWSSIKLSNLSSEHGDDIDTVYYINEMSSILNCLLVYFFSIYCIFTMFKIKRHVRGQLVLKHHNKTEHNEWEKLNAQSVHVRGMFPEDRRAELLMAEIEAFLEYKGGGRVLSLKVIPDFVEIVDLENERREVDDAHKLYTANEPAVRRMCFPSKYRNEEYYEKRIKDIDDEIEKVIMKPVLSSGHAFVCFDSIETRNKCLEVFNIDPKNTWEACWSIFKDKVTTFNHLELLRRRRMTSTFQKFNDEEVLNKLRERE